MGALDVTKQFEAWTFAGLPGKTLHVALFADVANCKYGWPLPTPQLLVSICSILRLCSLQGATKQGQGRRS